MIFFFFTYVWEQKYSIFTNYLHWTQIPFLISGSTLRHSSNILKNIFLNLFHPHVFWLLELGASKQRVKKHKKPPKKQLNSLDPHYLWSIQFHHYSHSSSHPQSQFLPTSLHPASFHAVPHPIPLHPSSQPILAYFPQLHSSTPLTIKMPPSIIPINHSKFMNLLVWCLLVKCQYFHVLTHWFHTFDLFSDKCFTFF